MMAYTQLRARALGGAPCLYYHSHEPAHPTKKCSPNRLNHLSTLRCHWHRASSSNTRPFQAPGPPCRRNPAVRRLTRPVFSPRPRGQCSWLRRSIFAGRDTIRLACGSLKAPEWNENCIGCERSPRRKWPAKSTTDLCALISAFTWLPCPAQVRDEGGSMADHRTDGRVAR